MVTCPEVEPPDHGRVEDYDIMYGSTITYSCDPGHQFDDMLQYSTSTCNRYGQWTAISPICVGMFNWNLFKSVIFMAMRFCLIDIHVSFILYH